MNEGALESAVVTDKLSGACKSYMQIQQFFTILDFAVIFCETELTL